MFLKIWYLKQNLWAALQILCRSLEGRNVRETYSPSGKCIRLLLAYNIFIICSTYLFTHSMGSFVCYKPLLPCKQGPGALIFIMHGVALSHILNLAVFNVSRLSKHPLGGFITNISICLRRILTEFTFRNFVINLRTLFEMFVIYWSGYLRYSARVGGHISVWEYN